jgi:hypothetical protein
MEKYLKYRNDITVQEHKTQGFLSPSKFQCEHHCPCYAMSQRPKICGISTERRYSSHNPRGKCQEVLGLVILGAMLGNRLFRSTRLESVRLKTEGQFFQNVWTLHPAGTTYHKAIAEPCSVLTCSGTHGFSRLLHERKSGPIMRSFIMSHHALTSGVSLRCSITS